MRNAFMSLVLAAGAGRIRALATDGLA